ncbi:MAG TPA: HEXXH motif-containing putative peptide modification protein [Labilithrix sp.]|nr:HEXXH motif-containing putative peptide modification protein [Labilithrix sp.]
MTTTFELQQRGFACAEESLDRGYLDAIVRRRSARIAGLFLKCFRRRLVASACGLEAILEHLGDEPFDMVWSSALGQLRHALLVEPRDDQRALIAATNMALHLAEKGRALDFEIAFESAQVFRFGNHLLPATRRLTFSAGGGVARLDGSDFTCTFSRAGSSWGCVPRARELAVLDTPGTAVLLLPGLPAGDSLPEGLAPSLADPAAIGAAYEAAYDVLAEGAPAYLAWVHRAVHSLLPVAARPGTTTSSSFELHPGVVALSHESPAIAMADALVHEASHQHFYILGQLGPVDDGSDRTLYFSPARRADRPIDKILLAYHAFANVLLFYRQCRSNGVSGGDAELCERQERDYEACLATLQRPLETTRALTPLGRALFEPLAARLA